MPVQNRFTIFDVMEKKGYFDSNPANIYSVDPQTKESIYKGPIQYPKMLYHPLADTKVIVPGEQINTPYGPKTVGEQREIINHIVSDEMEEAAKVAEGWHDHPAKAIKANIEHIIAGGQFSESEKQKLYARIPKMSAETYARDLEAEVKALRAELERARAGIPEVQPAPVAPAVGVAGNALGAAPAAPPPDTEE